jgi:hypothetical protein
MLDKPNNPPSAKLRSAPIPPFLFLWLFVLAISWKDFYFQYKLISMNLSYEWSILTLVSVADAWPSLLLLASLVSIALPRLRRRYMVWKFGLEKTENCSGVALEIVEFIKSIAPRCAVYCNFRRQDHLAFVFPVSFCQCGVAIFARMLHLWRAEPETSKAVLLHEMAHIRQGDHLVVGFGSTLQTYMRYWLLIFLLFAVCPVLISESFSVVELWREMRETDVMINVMINDMMKDASPELRKILSDLQQENASQDEDIHLRHLWSKWSTLHGPLLLLGLLEMLAWTLSLLIMPTAAIWCAEFCADRIAAHQCGFGLIRKAIETGKPTRQRWKRLLGFGTHPPRSLRLWFLNEESQYMRLCILLLVFPISILATAMCRAVLLSTYKLSSTYFDYSAGETLFIYRSAIYQDNFGYVSWLTGAVIILWPVLGKYWMRLITGQYPEGDPEPNAPYLIVGISVLLIGAIGYWMLPFRDAAIAFSRS